MGGTAANSLTELGTADDIVPEVRKIARKADPAGPSRGLVQ
jgi:hypothetical protein